MKSVLLMCVLLAYATGNDEAPSLVPLLSYGNSKDEIEQEAPALLPEHEGDQSPKHLVIYDKGDMIQETGNEMLTSPKQQLVIYANGKSEIIVKDINTRLTKKLFTIQIEQPTGGVCVDYKRDLLFFAHKDRVYRIHLVDDDGERKMSGKGELFTNDTANHLELSWHYPVTDKYASHLVLDASSGALYFMFQHGYFKIDSETMKKVKNGYTRLSSPTNFVLCNGMLYARSRGSNNAVYNISLRALDSPKSKWDRQLIDLDSISRLTIDKSSDRLYFTKKRNILGVLDGNITNTPIASMTSQVIMADSAFTKDIGSITVHEDIVVWSSNAWKVFYIGKLNKNTNFMLKQNVHVLDEHLYGPEHEISSNIVTLNV